MRVAVRARAKVRVIGENTSREPPGKRRIDWPEERRRTRLRPLWCEVAQGGRWAEVCGGVRCEVGIRWFHSYHRVRASYLKHT